MKTIQTFNELCEKLTKFKIIEQSKIEIAKAKKYKYISISIVWEKSDKYEESIIITDFPKQKSVSIEFLDSFRVSKNYTQAYKAITALFAPWKPNK